MRRSAEMHFRVALLAVAAVLAIPGTASVAQTPPPRWLGADDQPLPFRDDAELLAFLSQARVVDSKQLTSGINRPHRLLLELDGLRAHAIFRDVDEAKAGSHSAAERLFPSHRDSYLFEVAAYEMSRLLGLDNVPPAQPYRWNGREGSIQLWVENARSEAERLEQGEKPADPRRWSLQMNTMRIFDNLIFNFDRNHGNQLLDSSGKLWFVDHTRSFKPTPRLPSADTIQIIDLSLWRHLLALDHEVVRSRLRPYLSEPQLKALLKRHRLLIEHIQGLIDERGEALVVLETGGDDID